MIATAPTRTRWLTVTLMFGIGVLMFIDRVNISIAAKYIMPEYGLSNIQMGWILSGFGWTYAFCQMPGGWLVDHIRPRYFYPAILILWSVATACLGLVGSFVALFGLRLLIGTLEAPCKTNG